MMSSVLKRTKDLWGKAAESANSWNKNADAKTAAERKQFLATCDAAMRVEQWAVNKLVPFGARTATDGFMFFRA
jgi:hypothetical protein